MRRPLVLWAGLFALGVAAQGVLRGEAALWRVGIGLLGAASLKMPPRGPGPSIVVPLLIVALGGFWHARAPMSAEDGLTRHIGDDPVLLYGVVVDEPDEREDRTHYVLQVERVGPAGGSFDGAAPLPRPVRVRLTVPGPGRFVYGDVVQARALLERPRPATNPGAFDYEAYLQRQGIVAVARVPYARHASAVDHRPPNPFIAWSLKLRRALEVGLFGALPENTAQLLVGVTLGHRKGLPPDAEDAFRRAGLSHLLAVSGMHVGFLAAVARAVLPVLRLPRKFIAPLAAGVVWTYVFVTGARPSAVRAGVATTFGLFAVEARSTADGSSALAAGALLLMAFNPRVVYDVSFQLSFAATAAIVLGYSPLFRALRRRRWPKAVASSAALSVVAQWAVLPLVARVFDEVSTVGLIAGLLAGPFVAGLVPGALVVALLHHASPEAARLPAAVVHWLASGLEAIGGWFGAWPWAAVPVFRPSWLWIGAFWTLGIMLARGSDWSPRRRRAVWILAAVLAVGAAVGPPTPARLELVVLDVGQGDALFVKTASGVTAFVDGGGTFAPGGEAGPNPGEDVLLPYLRHRGVDRIDVVINTHPHEDHLQGLLPVLARYPVGLAVDSGQRANTPSWAGYAQFLQGGGTVRHVARAGDVLWLDDETYLEVLHPGPLLEGTRSDLNNNSVVVRVVYGDTAALLTGDIEAEAQLALLARGADLWAQVVKVPHHGSRLGLVTAFYEAVAPEVAVIPVGRNSHGHPSPEVIDTLEALGAAVYRTDVHGAVRLVSDSRRWSVHPMLPGS